MTKILVVDDDLALADVLAFTLRRAGFDVFLAHDGQDALGQYVREMPDLIVLDWMLPELDGLEVCKRVRSESNVPIIMLTVRYGDDDVVGALEAGADEYITKPFSPRQVVARVRALLRRVAGQPLEILSAGNFSLDVERHEAQWPGHVPIHLTRLETHLLEALLQNTGHVLATRSLIARTWGHDGATPDMLKQLIYRLRSKLDADGDTPVMIETIPNEGYSLKLKSFSEN
jgi:DNA-binding response OmpR family regulator